MSGETARNIGFLLVIAFFVFLVWKHLQTAPVGTGFVGGPFSQESDITAGDTGGGAHFYDPASDIAGNNVSAFSL